MIAHVSWEHSGLVRVGKPVGPITSLDSCPADPPRAVTSEFL